MDLHGTFCGIVEDNKDPEKLGRVKVRVPHAYGAIGGVFGAIATNDIPWALPAGLPAGMAQSSGGMDWLPELGDQVLVRFLDGEPEKPVWEWFMQAIPAVETFGLHSYDIGEDGSVGAPKRGALTRYGHVVEWNADGLIMTTSRGYRLVFTDASTAGGDGDISLSTQSGQFLELDDSSNTVTLNANEDFYINVSSQMLALCDSISLQAMSGDIGILGGNDFNVDVAQNMTEIVAGEWTKTVGGNSTLNTTGALQLMANSLTLTTADSLNLSLGGAFGITTPQTVTLAAQKDISLTTELNMSLNFLKLTLANGVSPYVLGDQLLIFLSELVAVLTAHTHSGVLSGPGSTGPMTPLPPSPPITLVSQTIFGK